VRAQVIDQTGSWGAFQALTLLDAGPYWDFSGPANWIMESLFLDVAHFWPAVGRRAAEFLGQGCGQYGAMADMVRNAAVWVTAATSMHISPSGDGGRPDLGAAV
jgi:hypothetical protein